MHFDSELLTLIEDFFHHKFMIKNNFYHAENYQNWKDINKWH